MQEWPDADHEEHLKPRASLILGAADLSGVHMNIWMGGARSGHGEEIAAGELGSAAFLDLAGDLPGTFRSFARQWTSFVFPDVEDVPPRFHRLQEIVDELHAALCEPAGAPADLYVMCTHGMNRSGLATGLLLRRLGMEGDEVISRITSIRKGALSNNRFRELILDA